MPNFTDTIPTSSNSSVGKGPSPAYDLCSFAYTYSLVNLAWTTPEPIVLPATGFEE